DAGYWLRAIHPDSPSFRDFFGSSRNICHGASVAVCHGLLNNLNSIVFFDCKLIIPNYKSPFCTEHWYHSSFLTLAMRLQRIYTVATLALLFKYAAAGGSVTANFQNCSIWVQAHRKELWEGLCEKKNFQCERNPE